ERHPHHTAAPDTRMLVVDAVNAPYRPSGTTGVLAVDDDGRIVHHLTHRRSGFRMVTSVCETGGRLVLGSLWERGIAVCEAPVTK
ncbi:SMP-30/gluconolactonase/LRE family protein, partial [Streptomyces sp. NPDC052127]